MSSRALIILLLVVLPHALLAQGTGRLQGKVIDTKTNEGLPGANVVVKGTYYGGGTNIDGEVKINIHCNAAWPPKY